MPDDLANQLLDLVDADLDVAVERHALSPETRLFDGGLQLDSFAVVELITLIEDRYGVEFADTDFTPENFVDFATLARLVARYRDAGAGDAAEAGLAGSQA